MKNIIEVSEDGEWRILREITDNITHSVLVISDQHEVLMATPRLFNSSDEKVFAVSLASGKYEYNGLALVRQLKTGQSINIKVG